MSQNHSAHSDLDPIETQEWLDALQSVLREEGPERAAFLLNQLSQTAGISAGGQSGAVHTPYVNTLRPEEETAFPGDEALEKKLTAIIRWNATAMVLKATRADAELGGHIASYASAAVLYETGFNHFFHADDGKHGGDLLYIQGHCAPGIYARAFLEGRLTEEQLANFRREVEVDGLSSYPHPWLMPKFWQFPTVSMGLGPLQAIYQARFLKYLQNRGLADTKNRKVWVFCGDGEMDEPESLGAISIAAREKLDNLVFVINCNLQRLDGPVRGNSKIIQEMEGLFRGAGWDVFKVIWGRQWDALLASDQAELLKQCMMETVDGEYQNYKAKDGAYVRKHFFGKYPELAKLVENMSDEDIWRLNRGGHDVQRVYAAYAAARENNGKPTLILAKTVKGYGMGTAGEGMNITHQQKKMDMDQLKAFRDRFEIPISDDDIENLPFYKPAEDAPEMQYLKKNRQSLGGFLPARRVNSDTKLTVPGLEVFASQLKDSGDRHYSTTMAFVRLINLLLKDKNISKHIVPIIPDEARTFGMEGMFRQFGIYSPVGQTYEPVDADQVMYYKEAKDGQILEEGISEAGAFSSWIAAATSYSTNNLPMIPFYIYYSMFGFQRVGDLAWAAGDMQARGFLLGAVAGRTTLAGEGLQHQDGHSHLLANTIPNCVTYDPVFGYELAVILQDGLRRMYQENENIFYYISVMNENYHHPEMPKDATEGILKGLYLFRKSAHKHKAKVQLMGSGTIFTEILAAAECLEKDYEVAVDIWSATSFNELAREAQDTERWNRFNPEKKPRQSYVTKTLKDNDAPIIVATDYVRAYAEQIRAFVPQSYTVLGTDGFGRSDTRRQLRHFFEVDSKHIVAAALKSLADAGTLPVKTVTAAMKKLGVSADKPNPITQ